MSAPVWPDELAGRVSRAVRASAAGQAAGEAGMAPAWPREFSLGRPGAAWIRGNFREALRWSDAVRGRVPGAEFDDVAVAGMTVAIPRSATFRTIDEAAAFSGDEALVRRMRDRAEAVRAAGLSPSPADLSRALRRTRDWEDADFSTLVAASAWFAAHDARGMRPRQVPIAGASGKWLDESGRRSLVSLLCGRADLGLASDPWPVTYRLLDPAHAGDEHAWALALPGRAPALPYEPSLAVIVENWSTFANFPAVPGCVAVYGAGMACVPALPGIGWLAACPDVAYWGDMDADGLEILDAVRARGTRCRSVLMDDRSFDRFAPTCGTRAATGPRPLWEHVARAVPNLAGGERALYERLAGPSAASEPSLRVEQERIPYAAALEALLTDS